MSLSMHNALVTPYSADHGGAGSRVVSVLQLAGIIAASVMASYLLVPDQSQLVERLMMDQQYSRIREMMKSSLGTSDGIDSASLQKLGPERLATLSHLLRLTPKEQLQTIFSASRPLEYDRFTHALTMSAVRYVDVIAPDQAWRMIEAQSSRMPPRYFAELASTLSKNALALTQPKLAATILARACLQPDSTVEMAHEMAQAYRWSGEPAIGASHLMKWLAKHESAATADAVHFASLGDLGAAVALEGGKPSLALDFQLQNLKALPADAPIEKGKIEMALSLANQSTRTPDVVPWLDRYVKSLPESSLDWKDLPDLAAKDPGKVKDYLHWLALLAQYCDWNSEFDASFDAHFRLAGMGRVESLDRCLALCDFLGRGEEMADLLQYSDVLKKRPELQAKLAELMAGLGRDAEALPLYRSWVASHPDDVEAAYDYACLLEDMGKEDESLAAFEQAVKLHPAHVPSVKKLAEACIRAGRHEQALGLYGSLKDEDHDHSTLENYALLAESLDRHAELFRAQVLHARQTNLTTVEPYLEIAETAAYLPSSRPAISVLDEGLKRFPESPSLRVALASVWLRDLGNIDQCYAILKHDCVKRSYEGVTMLLEIASSVPNQQDLLTFLGSDLEKKFELPPQSRLDLGVLCHACGQVERGEKMFSSVPEDARFLPFLAEARTHMNAYDEAIRLMTKYLSGNARATADDWVALGELYETVGRVEDAERAYEQSLTLLTSDLPAEAARTKAANPSPVGTLIPASNSAPTATPAP